MPLWFDFLAEEIYGSLSQYYDAQWLSLRATTYRLSNFLNDTRYTWDTIMNGKWRNPGATSLLFPVSLNRYQNLNCTHHI